MAKNFWNDNNRRCLPGTGNRKGVNVRVSMYEQLKFWPLDGSVAWLTITKWLKIWPSTRKGQEKKMEQQNWNLQYTLKDLWKGLGWIS
jgi:hypothetical protein